MEREELLVSLAEYASDNMFAEEEEVELNMSLLDDLGFDSLDTIELIMYAEEEYGIHISAEEVENLVTVNDIVDFMYNKLKDK